MSLYWISAKRKVELLAAQSCRGRPTHSGRIGRLILTKGVRSRCALKAISHYSVASLVHCINCISSGSCCCDKDCSLTAKNWLPRLWCPAASRLFDEPTTSFLGDYIDEWKVAAKTYIDEKHLSSRGSHGSLFNGNMFSRQPRLLHYSKASSIRPGRFRLLWFEIKIVLVV